MGVPLAYIWGTATLDKEGTEATPIPVGISPWVFELCRRISRAVFARPNLVQSAELCRAMQARLVALCFDALWSKLDASSLATQHALQVLFDVRFLKLSIDSSGLTALQAELEKNIFADPVDRLLYSEALKSALRFAVEGSKSLFLPLFLHSAAYAYFMQQKEGQFTMAAAAGPPIAEVTSRVNLLPIAMAAKKTNPPPPPPAASPQKTTDGAGGFLTEMVSGTGLSDVSLSGSGLAKGLSNFRGILGKSV